MSDWYDVIEDPVRAIVRALRDNGINTTCSCGHEMWIECSSYDPTTELRTIYNVFCEMGIREYDAAIRRHVSDGHPYDSIIIQIRTTQQSCYDQEKEHG